MDNNHPKRPKKKAKDKSSKSKKRKSKKSSDASHRKVAVVSRGLPNDATDQKDFTAVSDGEPQSHFTDTASHTQRSDSSSPSQSSNAPADSVDTYRWVEQLSDSEAESQRLELYKLRRRQRYEAAARRAIAAATTESGTGTFVARINMSDRQPLKMPSIYATNSSVSVPMYRNTVGSMTKLSTITC